MDWVDTFVDVTSGLRSPPIFRLWSGITAISGVLQRRVWTETETGINYPSLYVMLVGPPASGKSLPIIEVRKLWNSVRGLFVGPDNPTKAALVKRLSLSVRSYMNGANEPTTFSSLAVPCEEFGNLITKYDHEFLAMLSHIWNNPPIYDVPRAVAESFVIDKPNMIILAGVTPDTLGTTFPELAWNQGFTSRLLFIFSEKIKFSNQNLFRKRPEISTGALSTALASMFDLNGEMIWTPEAMDGLISWLEAGLPPEPEHSRLRYYKDRRFELIVRLAMIASVSAGRVLTVTFEDFDRARTWLLDAERFMPDVFRAMAQKSNIEIIAELHFHMRRLWDRRAVSDRVPIDDEIVWNHLAERVPSMSIPGIIETAERGGWIRRAPGFGPRPRWIPRPLNEINTKLT